VDMKLVGPSYNEVSNKERDKDILIHSIQYGSANKYDVIPMPAQNVSAEEAQILVDWILSLKDANK
jgi:cytochrome c